jgi:hypothetical protein
MQPAEGSITAVSWVKIDDGAPDHPKQLAAGAEACWLWVCGLAYCNRQTKRNGFIPEQKVIALFPCRNAQKLADRLVEVGLWEAVEGGYLVHDYAEFQPSENLRAARAAAGRTGGRKSGEVRRTKIEPSTKQVASSSEAVALNPDPVPDPISTDSSFSSSSQSNLTGDGGGTVAPPPRSGPAIDGGVFPMPDDFPLTDEARAAVQILGLRDIDDEWRKYRGHQIQQGRTSDARGWYAGFTQKWAVDAKRYQRRDREREASRGTMPDPPPVRASSPPPAALTATERAVVATEAARAREALANVGRGGSPSSGVVRAAPPSAPPPESEEGGSRGA